MEGKRNSHFTSNIREFIQPLGELKSLRFTGVLSSYSEVVVSLSFTLIVSLEAMFRYWEPYNYHYFTED